MITTRHKLTRYGSSLAVVLGVHAVAIIIALQWSAPQVVQLPPAAMVIDLAPMPAPPPPAPPKVVTPPQPPEPVEELPLPKLAEAPKPTIAAPKPVKPKPKPKPQPPKPEKKPEPPKEKPSEKPPSESPQNNAPAEKSAQPTPGPSPAQIAAKATWQSTLLGHLAKYKKYPPGAQARGKEGLNRLRFVVDAEGKVLSYELTGRSGNADLDRATLDMIRRAQPLPKPPPHMLTNGSIEITAPFVYNIEKRRR
ncbi:energy transducer TonB family protein [Pseudomonas mucidolens]|uniref:Protein TonB n=1 Tax=Pseudomonas mucidolens TaxID=46679 RepID=A0A1H2NVD4_9PSED|nr:energy transducer TonB [Pseudomonas mucidolens]SDV09380.1 protein TonB [Pseudomonas mucidolens]SQH37402.1 periplasmic energy transduction protein TonB [Pseudomonas mucidolens]